MSTLNRVKRTARPSSSVKVKIHRPRSASKPVAVSPVFTPPAPSRKPDTISKAGAPAYKSSDEWALLALLSTSFNEGSFYEGPEEARQRLKNLVRACPRFAAQAAIFVRNNLGNRSITQAAMVELANAPEAKGTPWLAQAFTQFCRRADDITCILAGQIAAYKKPVPNAMRRGLKKAFDKFDAYQLAKYRDETSSVTLVDAVNMLHPVPVERNAEALKALVKGDLRNAETWETLMSAAGNDITKKAAVWRKLLVEGKIGVMALVKNLRNIAQVCDRETVELAANTLVNPEGLRKGLVLPFRLITAYNELAKEAGWAMERLRSALREAADLACANVEPVKGNLAVFVDTSGSMGSVDTPKSAAQTASMFAAVLKRANPDADVFLYAYDSRHQDFSKAKGCLDLQQDIASHIKGGGTNLGAAYEAAAKRSNQRGLRYDAIVILSDEGTWAGAQAGATAHKKFCQATNSRPKVFTFDLAHTGTATFPEEDVFSLAGFSEKLIPLINLSLGSKTAFLDMVKAAVPLN